MKHKILAVDDSRTMRSILNQALTNAGFEVELAEDGQEGLDVLANSVPDLVITDINMPVMDGYGLIEGARARPECAGLPILVLSTESGDAMKARAREAGATGWIVKPFDEAKLVSVIKRLVA